ncbi:MAG: CbrC family protein [Lachnospiraceae bacterium]|nr:CbrC family protein [Lachnospiraceae bacterium]
MSDELILEPLRSYKINVTTDDEVVFMIPGYYPGEALVRIFKYDGGDNAILIRNKYQKIYCDCIHPDVRNRLYSSRYVIIIETDTGRNYRAVLDHDGMDVDPYAIDDFHDYAYDLNPYPLMNGTFDTGFAVCSCCGEKKSVFLKTRSLTEDDPDIVMCPKCISEGQAAGERLNLWPGLSERCMRAKGNEELIKTPPFKHDEKPGGTWGIHCGALGIYLGKIATEDLIIDMWSEIVDTWNNDMNPFRDEDPGTFYKRIDKEEVSAYLFRCTECGKHYCLFFEN